MKKYIFMLLALLMSMTSFAQKDSVTSKLDEISKRLQEIQENQVDLERYKVYPTENIYTFLKLDTKTGRIQQLQWSLDKENEGTLVLNDIDLSVSTIPCKFELYPTKNMYQFILVNQTLGWTWHVQWGIGENKRWIRQISM